MCVCLHQVLAETALYPVVTTPLAVIFKLLSNFLFFCRIREHNIVFSYLFILIYEKSIFKARIGELNLSEPMKPFLVIALCYNFMAVLKDFCILYFWIFVSKISDQKTADG